MDFDELYERAWFVLAFLVVIGIVGLLGVMIIADHTPQSYYVNNGVGGTVCASAANNWDADFDVWCSNDPSAVIAFVKNANATVK